MSYGTVKLNDGTNVPAIAFGAGSVWKFQDVTPYVLQALRAGFTHLDNAQYYATEKYVGAAIEQSGLPRERLYIVSKFSGVGLSVDEAFSQSLSQLGVDQLDLYLIHFPSSAKGDIPGVWRKLEGYRKRGATKSIGVSNFGIPDLEVLLASADVVPAVNQIQLHPYNYDAQLPTLTLCAERGIAVEAYSSLTPITRFPGGPVDAVLERITKRVGGTPAMIIFQWLRQKGIVIVTTSGKLEHLQEYLDVPTLQPLTEDEIAEIEAAGREGAEAFEAIEAAELAAEAAAKAAKAAKLAALASDEKGLLMARERDLEKAELIVGGPSSSSPSLRTRIARVGAVVLGFLVVRAFFGGAFSCGH